MDLSDEVLGNSILGLGLEVDHELGILANVLLDHVDKSLDVRLIGKLDSLEHCCRSDVGTSAESFSDVADDLADVGAHEEVVLVDIDFFSLSFDSVDGACFRAF